MENEEYDGYESSGNDPRHGVKKNAVPRPREPF